MVEFFILTWLQIIKMLHLSLKINNIKRFFLLHLYDHGPILLSDKGILWIQFKKKDNEIPKGEIYRNENSVMRYQEW